MCAGLVKKKMTRVPWALDERQSVEADSCKAGIRHVWHTARRVICSKVQVG